MATSNSTQTIISDVLTKSDIADVVERYGFALESTQFIRDGRSQEILQIEVTRHDTLRHYNIYINESELSRETVAESVNDLVVQLDNKSLLCINGHTILLDNVLVSCYSCDSHTAGSTYHNIRNSVSERVAKLYAIGGIINTQCH